jgi:hypothetical protein
MAMIMGRVMITTTMTMGTGMGMGTRTVPGRAGWRRSAGRTSGGSSSRWC